jgi:hypothetical protein
MLFERTVRFKLAILALAGGFLTAAASASPLCTGQTLAQLSTAANSVCSSDNGFYNLTFGPGTYNNASGAPANLTAADVVVSVTGDTLLSLAVAFSPTNGNSSFANASDPQTTHANSTAYYNIFYVVIPVTPNYGIIQETMALQNAIVADHPLVIPGVGSLSVGKTTDVTAQKYANNVGTSVPQLSALNTFQTLSNTASTTGTATTTVLDAITLTNSYLALATFSGYSSAYVGDATHPGAILNSFVVAPLTPDDTIPELSTMWMIGLGLSVLGVAFRKKDPANWKGRFGRRPV